MVLKTIVVIGSRKYRKQSMVYHVLDEEIIVRGLDPVIMSGKCPMTDSVDNWAIFWAENRGLLNIELEPRDEEFFERNEQIAHYADEIIAFIPKNIHRSGAWNCISEFRKMGKTAYRVFDENGDEWDRKWA